MKPPEFLPHSTELASKAVRLAITAAHGLRAILERRRAERPVSHHLIRAVPCDHGIPPEWLDDDDDIPPVSRAAKPRCWDDAAESSDDTPDDLDLILPDPDRVYNRQRYH